MTFRATPPTQILGDWLDHHAAALPHGVALELDALRITYGELQSLVEKCARAFVAMGLTRGSVVAVLCSPRPEALISFLAATRIGVVWLGLNPRYQLPEIAYLVGDARPSVLLSIDVLEGRSYCEDVAILQARFDCIKHTVIMTRREGGVSSFYDWLSESTDACRASVPPSWAADAAAPALLVYTSGSSGRPKGVLLRQRELIARSLTQLERFGTAEPPRLINPFPINHISGMHWVGLYGFIGGGTIRYLERFSAQAYVQGFEQHFLNVVILMPAMFRMLVDHPGYSHALLDQLDCFVFSGATMPRELVEALQRARCRVGLTYGMTESCGSVTYSDPGSSTEVLLETIGRPYPPSGVRVADSAGQPVAAGTIGEIQVRREFCMAGYLHQPDATHDAFTSDGWLRTGDLAELRADGNLRFAGRRSEMFKSGGYNVYPREVELCLEGHEAVAVAAVVSVPDPVFEEVGWAYVVAAPGASTSSTAAILQWCKGQLANYKIPKKIVVCGELPLLPAGKVDKLTLREAALAELAAA